MNYQNQYANVVFNQKNGIIYIYIYIFEETKRNILVHRDQKLPLKNTSN